MITSFFTAIFYQPLYNGLVFLMFLLPGANVGIIIILFTLIVRLILFPVSQKSIKTQLRMKEIGPELEAIKEKYKNDKQEQAKQTMQVYKEKGINPFAGFFAMIIQLIILICLYRIFYTGSAATISMSLVYSFIHAPTHVSTIFFSIIDLSKKNIIFAALAAVTQFFQAQIITPPAPTGTGKSMANDLARSMTFQAKYVLPLFIFFIAYALPSAVSLYWITTNLFSIAQELYVRKMFRKKSQTLILAK